MSDPFARMIDACFARLGSAATYTPAGGAGVAVTAIARRPDRLEAPLGTPGFRLGPAAQAAALVADVRRSEVAAPARGDTLALGGLAYPVIEAEIDSLGLVWRLVLGPPS
ncbi:MAG: hypothetical protein HY521_13080 [Proteobacteria bacterium]|nr:hypothetical protein [Pseudomonadota bacterium]